MNDRYEQRGTPLPLSDFSAVTEFPGSLATRAQLDRFVQRYAFAADHVRGRRTFEAACGTGMGLGYLGRHAAFVVGGDCTESVLREAKAYHRKRLPLIRLDAHELPFGDGSFDAVVLFEALYYLRRFERFLEQSRRVLTPGGVIVISSVNPEWSGFSPSAFSTRYPTVSEICAALGAAGFRDATCHGGFPALEGSVTGRLIGFVRHAAVTLHLVPRTLRARALLKRAFYGKMTQLTPEVMHGAAKPHAPTPICCDGPVKTHQIVYVVARRA